MHTEVPISAKFYIRRRNDFQYSASDQTKCNLEKSELGESILHCIMNVNLNE